MTIEELKKKRATINKELAANEPAAWSERMMWELAEAKLAVIRKLADYGCNPEDMVNDIHEVLDV